MSGLPDSVAGLICIGLIAAAVLVIAAGRKWG
jgi:hypothetical protein